MIARVRPLAALLLLALWLPVTQHCGLEAAGWLTDAADCHERGNGACQAEHEDDSCDIDNCRSIEDGAYKSAFAARKITAPATVICRYDLQAFLPEPMPAPLVSPERTNPPPELGPTWQFEVRAAPSPRAPTAVS